MSYASRDEAKGILGTLSDVPAPIAEDSDMRGIEEKVWAHLGREPDDFVYVADEGGRVLRIMTCDKHHERVEKAQRTTGIGWGLFILCVTTLIGSSLGGLGTFGIFIFAAIACLYLLVVLLGIQNEFEGVVLCEIILILILTMIPTLQKARNAKKSPVTTNTPQLTSTRLTQGLMCAVSPIQGSCLRGQITWGCVSTLAPG